MREVGRLFALVLSVASLYALLDTAFFILGGSWQLRLERSVTTLGIATCVCFASGIVFTLTESATESAPGHATRQPSLHSTLPVRLYYWGVGATALLFLLSLYLETYYVPYLYKNQPW